jgi:hypothetical protein
MGAYEIKGKCNRGCGINWFNNFEMLLVIEPSKRSDEVTPDVT